MTSVSSSSSHRAGLDAAVQATIAHLRSVSTFGDAEQEAACFADDSERQLIACLAAMPDMWPEVAASGLRADDCALPGVHALMRLWVANAAQGGSMIGDLEATYAAMQASGQGTHWAEVSPLFTATLVVPDVAIHARQIQAAAAYRRTRLALFRAILAPPKKVRRALAALAEVSGPAHGAHGVQTGPAERAPTYPVLTDEEAERLTPAQGILGDILYEDAIAYLYGDSDTWKTFIAVSWGLSIAADQPWLGCTVMPGPVVYVPAEGARGIGKRIHAWKQYHHISDSVDFYVVPIAVNLLDPEAIPRLMADIEAHPRLAGHKPALIIFDTLARSMDGGDENSTADAARVTASVSLLKARWGCCVLILHHVGNLYAHRMRGNSGFRNNGDIAIRVIAPPLPDGQKRTPGDAVTLHSDKTKEEASFEDITVTTELQEWTGDDGAPHSSLVVVASDQQPVRSAHPAIMPASSVTALRTLGRLKWATATEWYAASGLPRRTFYEARDDLEEREYVGRDSAVQRGAHYGLSEAGDKVLSAMVRRECDDGAVAPSGEGGTERGEGAKPPSAPSRREEAATPELFGIPEGADANGVYTPSHLRTFAVDVPAKGA
jgi:hypothetical protein